MHTITTEHELRQQFWTDHPRLDRHARITGKRGLSQNAHGTDTRCAFVDWIDHMCRSGQISEALAERATL